MNHLLLLQVLTARFPLVAPWRLNRNWCMLKEALVQKIRGFEVKTVCALLLPTMLGHG